MIRLSIEHKSFLEQVLFESFELELGSGELLCLLGPSGCGKTTLLNLLAGLDKEFKGALQWQTSAQQTPKLGYMFQQPRLLPWRTVRQNLAWVIDPAQQHRIDPLLAQLGLADYADSYPNRLSLGMARRVALARCLIVDPQLILMDEPFVSLDPPTAAEMRRWIMQVRRSRPQSSILFVTHDIREALSLADRIMVLGERPTRVMHQWQSSLAADERSAEFIREQEQLLLGCYPHESRQVEPSTPFARQGQADAPQNKGGGGYQTPAQRFGN